MIDLSTVKLGKLRPKEDKRTLKLSKYINVAHLPHIPKSYGWSKGIRHWELYQNDSIGDCAIAAPAHMISTWTYANFNMVIPHEADVIKAYSDVSGYNPNTGDNDNGCVLLDVLNYWRKTGIAGHKIGAYVSIHPQMRDHVKLGLYIFGGLDIGLQLPISCQDQHIWDFNRTDNPEDVAGSWGGHSVSVTDYDEKHIRFISWGKEMFMTWDFFEAYCDECFAIISPDFVQGRILPNGFDIANLNADLKLL